MTDTDDVKAMTERCAEDNADNPIRALRGWAKAYRDNPQYRFPSDPNAEFFPADLEFAAEIMEKLAADLLDRLSAQAHPSAGPAVREALTPSAATKAAYSGEFKFDIPMMTEDGEEHDHSVTVPWTTIKEIMAAISSYAALLAPSGPSVEDDVQRRLQNEMYAALKSVESEMKAGFGSSFGETREQVRRAISVYESSTLFNPIEQKANADTRPSESVEDIERQTIERCAKCVPTNWLDSLLTGKDAPRTPLDNRGVERLLRGIQDRIRALTQTGEK